MLLLAILGNPRLFLTILSNFNIWLLVVILLVAIGYYFIGEINGY
jgi:hypothetical protein